MKQHFDLFSTYLVKGEAGNIQQYSSLIKVELNPICRIELCALR